MGCSASKLEDEEAVKLCRDRRNFIRQAVDLRTQFASGHIAYLHSLKRVSLALHNFVNGEEHHDFLLDSYSTPPFTPVKRLNPEIIGAPLKSLTPTPKSLTPTPYQSEKSTTVHVMRYLRSTANPSVSVEERPQSSETVRIDSYYPSSTYGIDGYFAMEASQMNNYSSSFFPSPYNNRPSYPPPSPQNSQWDFFWNPFSSWDSYGYPSQITTDDEMARLRQVREEEGIPELEEDNDDDDDGHIREEEEDEEDEEEENTDGDFIEVELKDKRDRVGPNHPKVKGPKGDVCEISNHVVSDTVHELKGLQSQGVGSIEVAKEPKVVDLELSRSEQAVVGNREGAKEEIPGFTVYVRRHTSMREVMKEIENQFVRICDCAHEISVMLEASRAQYSSNSSELTAIRMLNPVALFHSASSRSTSSRFFLASSSSKEIAYNSSSDYSEEESSMISGSHQSTLDRLYAWEKKLYKEVKSGERIRVAYEKKCKQLQNQDVNGDEPSSVFKTRAAIRDLYTKLKVSIHTVESISKRIETLRDEELHPQLMELLHGLARMWRTMGECHRIQKRAIDDAKLIIMSTFFPFPTATKHSDTSSPPKPPRSAINLESELRNWRSAFANWTAAISSYARSFAGWAHRCSGPTAASASASDSEIPAFDVCSRWAGLMESLGEGAQVMDGLDFFAAGIGSVYRIGVEEEEEEGLTAPKKTAELAGRVLCAGMSVAVGNLTEFAVKSAEGYEGLLLEGRT